MNKQDPEYLDHLRHSTAHLLAAAVMDLYPHAHRTIGPAIENGFYFDFDFGDTKVSEEDLPKIEEKMKQIIKSWKGFDRSELTADAAKKEYPGNVYKHELIDEFAGEGQTLTFYKSGEYSDLCRGGHVAHPNNEIKHFKLLSLAGAYWRGNEKNKMLTRIYGTVFPTKIELDDYLLKQEEARLRDHRKLGKELDLFVFSDLVGSGLPLFTPKGTILRDQLTGFSEELQRTHGYEKVTIPHIAKVDLYKTSGHYDKYPERFSVTSAESTDEFMMKPMNCPHHAQIYASRPHSYRELPVRYMETTTNYRDEKAGELHGLSRVRSLTQDDAHVFCTMEQIEGEFTAIVEMIKKMYTTLGMEFRARLSFRDDSDKYLGTDENWERAQTIIESLAKKLELPHFVAEGEAAFYGPKIDIMVKDALGREWQCATEQLDFTLPERFGLKYTDADGSEKTPVMIHKALLGSIERFLSVYIEHTGGRFPLWLSPVQVKVLPIGEKHMEYAKSVTKSLSDANIRVELDSRSETLGAKIRDGELQKTPYLLIVGDKEVEAEMVAPRARGRGNEDALGLAEFISNIQEKIRAKALEV